MILVAVLIGIALCVVAGAIFGRPAVVTLASFFAVLVVIGVGADVVQSVHDRRTAYRRWREWRR